MDELSSDLALMAPCSPGKLHRSRGWDGNSKFGPSTWAPRERNGFLIRRGPGKYSHPQFCFCSSAAEAAFTFHGESRKTTSCCSQGRSGQHWTGRENSDCP